MFKILDQLLDILQGNRIVVAGPYTTNTAMALQPLEQLLIGTSQERLLLLGISAMHTEANVHSASDALVRDDAVHLRVLVQYAVDEVCLAVGNVLLARDLKSTVGGDEVSHDLTGDPQVEDRKGVVEGVVFCDGGVVEDRGPGHASDVQTVKEGCRGSCCLRGEKRFLDNGDCDTGDTDVLLGAALSKPVR